MKKLVLFFACVFMTSMAAMADNDKPISVEQLPAKAQTFLNLHFTNLKVALAKQETEIFNKSYDVVFTTGEQVEFDKSGEWTEVKCRLSEVPAAIVPEAIQTYISTHYPDTKILEIERDRKEYDVTLSNRLEITFDAMMRVIDIDD